MPSCFTYDPAFAYEQVLAFAGASVAGATAAGSPASGTSLLRDPVDTNIVANVRNKSGQIIDFISSNSFAGVYLSTNFGVAYSGYTNAAVYWVAQGFTNFVGVNPWPVLDSAPQPLDSDWDGIPDYWEITLGTDPFVASNNNDRNGDGYTDLEEYINWLAAPHARYAAVTLHRDGRVRPRTLGQRVEGQHIEGAYDRAHRATDATLFIDEHEPHGRVTADRAGRAHLKTGSGVAVPATVRKRGRGYWAGLHVDSLAWHRRL